VRREVVKRWGRPIRCRRRSSRPWQAVRKTIPKPIEPYSRIYQSIVRSDRDPLIDPTPTKPSGAESGRGARNIPVCESHSATYRDAPIIVFLGQTKDRRSYVSIEFGGLSKCRNWSVKFRHPISERAGRDRLVAFARLDRIMNLIGKLPLSPRQSRGLANIRGAFFVLMHAARPCAGG
jgi:hypothetical protein